MLQSHMYAYNQTVTFLYGCNQMCMLTIKLPFVYGYNQIAPLCMVTIMLSLFCRLKKTKDIDPGAEFPRVEKEAKL